MRVFITGASGFVGTALVPELLGAGHQVIGLARSEASAAALRQAGAAVHLGSLEDEGSLRAGAAAADAVVHLAFLQDMARFTEAARIDEQAVVALGTALAGSGRPLVVATGMGVVAGRHAAVPESDSPPAARLAGPRAALRFVGHNVRTTIVSLPPITYGRGDTRGLLTRIIAVARAKNVSAFIGDGSNRWPTVHVLDAARLFRLALERLPSGAAVHAVAGEGVPLRSLAEAVGRQLGVPAASIAASDAEAHFGWLGRLLGRTPAADRTAARELLGWEPAQRPLLEEVEAGDYFK